MSLFDKFESFMKSTQKDLEKFTSDALLKVDSLVEDNLMMTMNSSEIGLETVKELAFGGLLGMCAGYAAKKTGAPVLIGVSTASFLLLRGAIFDGHIQATWSPLAIDDASFARHMQRKIRRETMSGEQRLDKFLQQNGLILTAFSGGVVISQIAS